MVRNGPRSGRSMVWGLQGAGPGGVAIAGDRDCLLPWGRTPGGVIVSPREIPVLSVGRAAGVALSPLGSVTVTVSASSAAD